jgi:hypothetical protein
MKPQTLTFALALTSILISCNGNQSQEQNKNATTENVNVLSEQIYLYAENKDTVLMVLERVGDIFVGRLDMLPYEKDSRIGTLTNGQLKGDTLYALYHSTQEGQNSECEIALLKKEDTYILTNDIYGENYQYNADYTKGSFKNKSMIKFDGEILKLVKGK